ncbi:MAG: cupin domain-containing protein [Epsilonproteobacteria bacterium]|nr:cupin domain-containing protein [Campylobacterota bacterium]
MAVKVTQTGIRDPKKIEETLKEEGFFNIFLWHDSQGTTYPTHTHPYHEVRWIVEGTLVIEEGGEEILLKPGDRLESPPNRPHRAYCPTDVTYICGSR